MNNLKFGLNVTKKQGSKISFSLGRKKTSTLLSSQDDDEEPIDDKDHIQVANSQIKAIQSVQDKVTEELQKKALEECPTVFDYDAVYDGLKRKEWEKKKERDGEDGVRKKARYIEGLLKASNKRKIELERAEERRIQRERDLEGEEFGDKEMFVTDAYRKRQEELRKMEEEEKRKEEEESNSAGKNMSGFYRDLLNQRERDAIDLNDIGNDTHSDLETQRAIEEEERRQVKTAVASGAIQTNDSDEIVDKRQLLAGGLNMTARAVHKRTVEEEQQRTIQRQQEEEKRILRDEEARRLKAQQAERNRQHIQQQQQEAQQRLKQAKEQEMVLALQNAQSKVSESQVSEARLRYLARKKKMMNAEESNEL